MAQIDRILNSSHFVRSQTLTRLLRFIVQLSLDGKADELKEYRLGVDVFDRGAEFDPRIDPIVRMQAAKLRARLAEYYASDGREDRMIISIPKGGYAPSFTRVGQPAPPNAEPEAFRSIAVLPFVNISADPENEYFSDGLTEELINLLTTVPGLRVVARTSVFGFKNVSKDIREIGAKLNVQTVLEGTVRKAGNQLRVTAQLIDVSSGYHLLSRAYPRELKDVFAVQEELANAVVTEIMPQMRASGPEHTLRVHAADLTAYNLYLKGMFTLSKKFTGPGESIAIFEEALKLAPNYAPAWAGIAYANFIRAWYSILPAHQAMPLAKLAAGNAIQLDAQLAMGYTILGAVQAAYEWDWIASERSFRQAIALQPNLALAHQLLSGSCLLGQGRIVEAVAATEQALLLNPFDAMLRAAATHTFAVSGDYEAAQQHYLLGVEINSKTVLVYRAMGLAHQAFGRLDQAIAMFRIACELSDRAALALAALGNAMAQVGDRSGAEALLEEVAALTPASALALAILHIGVGNVDESLDWLERAIDDREAYAVLLPVDVRFAALRRNRRYESLLGRMKLSPRKLP